MTGVTHFGESACFATRSTQKTSGTNTKPVASDTQPVDRKNAGNATHPMMNATLR